MSGRRLPLYVCLVSIRVWFAFLLFASQGACTSFSPESEAKADFAFGFLSHNPQYLFSAFFKHQNFGNQNVSKPKKTLTAIWPKKKIVISGSAALVILVNWIDGNNCNYWRWDCLYCNYISIFNVSWTVEYILKILPVTNRLRRALHVRANHVCYYIELKNMAPAERIVNLKQFCWFKGINPQSFTAAWFFKITTPWKHSFLPKIVTSYSAHTASTCSDIHLQNINKVSVYKEKPLLSKP